MYCIQCGIELSDDAIFCPKCGKRAADADRQADDKSQSVHSTEKVDMVMDTGRSPFTLAFTIAFSAQILFSLVDSNFSLLSVIALILETVICVGSWMVYVSSYQHLASPTGFSVLHIGVPIYLVFSMFQMFRSAIVDAVVYPNIIMESAMIIGFMIVVVLRIWCYIGLCVTTNYGHKIMNGKSAEWRVSTPCFVIMIILTILGLFGAITGFGDYSNVAAILSFLAYIATSILAVVILAQIRYKQQ